MFVAALAAVAICVVRIAPAAAADAPARPASWENSPYRILVYVEIDPAAEWTAPRRADLLTEIEKQARTIVGGLWQLKAVETPAELHWNSAADIGRVAMSVIPEAALAYDKVMLIGVAPIADGSRRIHVRESDARTRIWGAAVQRESPVGSDLAQEIVHRLWDSFSPLVRIDAISEQGVVTACVRGGSLPPAMRSLELVRPGMPFRSLIRHFDAKGATAKDGVFPIAWTWLRVEQVDGPIVKCQLETGVQDPLELHYDGRTEYLGLALTARAEKMTELVVQARGATDRPLEDLEVYVRKPGEKSPQLVGRTDQRGSIQIASPAIELDTVLVRSGDELLARFPMVPGAERSVVAQVEDNGRRLESGNFVARLGEELIDLAAQETVLKARFQRQFVRGNLAEAEKTLATLKSLKTSEKFLQSIAERRDKLPGIAGDPLAVAWLDKRLDQIKPLAANPKYLIDSQTLARLDSLLAGARARAP